MSYKTTGHAPEEEVVEVVASGDAEAQEKLAKYGITNPSFLGAGNFGRVYKGIKDGKTDVAVKFLVRSSKCIGRFDFDALNEVSIMRGVEHPNICKVYEYIYEAGLIIMDVAENGALQSFLENRTEPLDTNLRFKFLSQIAEGMIYLHQYGIYHRDLRCANILVDKGLNAKIADFGIAVLKDVPIPKSFKETLFWGRTAYQQQEDDPERRDIRCYGIISLKLLLFGDTVASFDTEITDALTLLPEWVTPGYKSLISLCCAPFTGEDPRLNFKNIGVLVDLIEKDAKNIPVEVKKRTSPEVFNPQNFQLPNEIVTILQQIPYSAWDTKSNLINQLGNYPTRHSTIIDMLLQTIKDGEHVVRDSSANALGNLGVNDPKIIKALLELDMKASAAKAIKKIGAKNEEILTHLIQSDLPYDALKETLLEIGTTLPELLHIIQFGKKNVKPPRSATLGTVDLNKLRSEHPYQREQALSQIGLSATKDAKVLDEVIQSLQDSEPLVRGAAALALAELNAVFPKVVDALSSSFQKESGLTRATIGLALCKLKKLDRSMMGPMVSMSDHSMFYVRKLVATALGALSLAEEDILLALSNLQHDKDNNVAKEATRSLNYLFHNGIRETNIRDPFSKKTLLNLFQYFRGDLNQVAKFCRVNKQWRAAAHEIQGRWIYNCGPTPLTCEVVVGNFDFGTQMIMDPYVPTASWIIKVNIFNGYNCQPGSFDIRVFRRNEDTITMVGIQPFSASHQPGYHEVALPKKLEVQKGDLIGLGYHGPNLNLMWLDGGHHYCWWGVPACDLGKTSQLSKGARVTMISCGFNVTCEVQSSNTGDFLK